MNFVAQLHHTRLLLRAMALAVLVQPLALSAGTLAQGGGYELQPQIVGAGGSTLQGGNWTLDGTVAQTDAIVQDGAGGLRLEGGFWPGVQGAVVSDRVFASGFDP
jgi:hypothetical protein